MRRAGVAPVLAGVALLGAASASATLGGPTLCEVLGWDPASKRVYVHEIPRHGGDAFGSVRSVDCAGTGEPVPRDERLVLLAFRGDPSEGGYEVQVPLVVKERESGVRRVGWNPGGR